MGMGQRRFIWHTKEEECESRVTALYEEASTGLGIVYPVLVTQTHFISVFVLLMSGLANSLPRVIMCGRGIELGNGGVELLKIQTWRNIYSNDGFPRRLRFWIEWKVEIKRHSKLSSIFKPLPSGALLAILFIQNNTSVSFVVHFDYLWIIFLIMKLLLWNGNYRNYSK